MIWKAEPHELLPTSQADHLTLNLTKSVPSGHPNMLGNGIEPLSEAGPEKREPTNTRQRQIIVTLNIHVQIIVTPRQAQKTCQT